MKDSLEEKLESGESVITAPKGRSMLPFLKEKRDCVVVSKPQSEPKKYDIVLYRHGGMYVLHRIVRTEENFFVICGDNSAVREKVEKSDIIGAVTSIVRKNKIISADGTKARLLMFLWYGCGIKRAVFLVRRIAHKFMKLK